MLVTSVGPGEGWVGPVGGGDGGLVLLGARLVEHRQQLRRVVGQRLQIHHGVRAVTVIAAIFASKEPNERYCYLKYIKKLP